ncbi:hypothetical protein ACFLQL_04160, partial [Verrucomicrobiota bacterium]
PLNIFNFDLRKAGFVSNSSSSSFFFMGTKLTKKVTRFDPKKTYTIIDYGWEGEGGLAMFDISGELSKLINNNPEYFKHVANCNIYEILIGEVDDGDGSVLTDRDIDTLIKARQQGKKISILHGECDQNSPYDVESFEKYMDFVEEMNE